MTPREALITLNLIPGLGSVRIQTLLEHFAAPELILEAPVEHLGRIPGIGTATSRAIASWRQCTSLDKELALAQACGARITTLCDDDYPSALRSMYDPPIVLYSRGQWNEQDSTTSISIVGSRLATHYGHQQARRFARELADAGITVISGLARGIDSAAHLGALDARGRTLAILGSGLNRLYPAENRPLADQIENGAGAVLSEFPMDMQPSKSSFPMRNRIVAAWSQATLVVEAPARSGALHTARLAGENNRTVYAIPGPIDRPQSQGCHDLIRDGAILVTRPQDILDDQHWNHLRPQPGELPLFTRTAAEAATPPLTDPLDLLIIDSVRLGNDGIDTLCPATGLPAHELTPRLARLQITRHLLAIPGGRFALP